MGQSLTINSKWCTWREIQLDNSDLGLVFSRLDPDAGRKACEAPLFRPIDSDRNTTASLHCVALRRLKMSRRAVYLVVSGSIAVRAHFGIFIPNKEYNRITFGDEWHNRPCIGTMIQVSGEPLMAGYKHEFKRNFECSPAEGVRKLVLLGHVDDRIFYDPASTKTVKESTARCCIETIATTVPPPPARQDIRAPIDGVSFRPDLAAMLAYANPLMRR